MPNATECRGFVSTQDGPEHVGPLPSPFVAVYDGAGEPALRLMLEQLNLAVADPASGSDFQRPGCGKPVAAVVTDADAAPLERCTALSSLCPVILISDDSSFERRLAAAEAGVSAFVARPVNPTELAEWLQQFAEQHVQRTFSVLIVDDDWLAAELNADVLRSAGAVVRTLSDPRQTLAAIEEAPPDLILMDMKMPGIDGIRLAQIIRQSRPLISLPIVFLSAERDEARQLMARQLGGDDFISKPVKPERLIAVVNLRAERSRSLRSLIERDRLTGLYDSSRFQERLAEELERCRRHECETSLVMIDIDHFKQVNDRFGHAAGDNVLRTLASSLAAGLRQIDVVGRCGGEEFGVLLRDTDVGTAATVADRLRERFGAQVFKAGPESFSVTFSAGVASTRSKPYPSELMQAADAMLYAAKRGGRNKVEIAHPVSR